MGGEGHHGLTAYVYTWDPGAKQWCFAGMEDTEGAAREKGRSLWRSGAHGIRIDVIQTVVEEKRKE